MPDLSGSRVLVTGASGFIGRRLVPALLGRGAEVHTLTRRDPQLVEHAADVRCHHADLADASSVHSAVAASRPDVVLHLAVARGEATEEQRRMLWLINAMGTVALLEACAECGCGRLVNAGSSLEYGLSETAHGEFDVPRPHTAFGASKAAGTAAVVQAGLSGRLETSSLRIFSVYGPDEPRHRLVPTAIRSALTGAPLSLTPPGFVRDFVFIDDVCDALLRAASADGLPDGAVFNVGTGIETSNEEMVEAIERAVGRPVARATGQYEPHLTDKTCWSAEPSYARQVLGWEATTSIAEGLAQQVEHVKSEVGGVDV